MFHGSPAISPRAKALRAYSPDAASRDFSPRDARREERNEPRPYNNTYILLYTSDSLARVTGKKSKRYPRAVRNTADARARASAHPRTFVFEVKEKVAELLPLFRHLITGPLHL